MSLTQEYRAHGIHFRYPPNWELLEEPQEDAFTVSVSDMGTFWSVTVLDRSPSPERVLMEATDAFLDEYDDVDEYPSKAVLSGVEADANNLEFMSLELVNCVFLCAAQVGDQTLFVMTQVTDHEREEYADLFDAMTASLTLTSEEGEAEIE